VASLEAAARLEPKGAHVLVLLARARLAGGDRRGALEAVRRVQALREDFPGARELLRQLEGTEAGGGG
jgi:hypothetical protein